MSNWVIYENKANSKPIYRGLHSGEAFKNAMALDIMVFVHFAIIRMQIEKGKIKE